MSDIVIVGIDAERETDETMAKEMLADLVHAYPGHAWFVAIKGGVVHVKDLDLNDKWGMCLHYSQIKHDANDRKRDVLRAAGEFLERANVARGAKRAGQDVTSIEGVPQKWMRP
jgi:hypothetical protein